MVNWLCLNMRFTCTQCRVRTPKWMTTHVSGQRFGHGMPEWENPVLMDKKPWDPSMYPSDTIAWDTAQGELPAALAVRAEKSVHGPPGTSAVSISISIWACRILLCVCNCLWRRKKAKCSWLIPPAGIIFHIVMSSTFLTSFAALGPLVHDLVS